MSAEAVQGLAEANALFDRIPAAAREQLGPVLSGIARDELAAQRRDVRKKTGKLAAGLSIQLLIDDLRARVGLIGVAAKTKRARGRNYGSLYYGRFVEFGRKAQTVLAKRAGGREYKLRVSALPARPFILVDRPEIRAEQRLANFWAETLAKAGTA